MEKNVKISVKVKDISKTKKNSLFIEGGGTRGIFAIGILQYLFGPNDYIIMNDVHIYGGTSVGSYLATALSIGFNKDDITNYSKTIDLNNLIDNRYYFMPAVYRFLSKGYLYDDTGRKNIIKNILNFRINKIQNDLGTNIKPEELNFSHLQTLIAKYPCTYKDLIINTVDISRGKQIFMTTLNDDFSNITLMDAMLASSAIPYVFKPLVLYNLPGTNKYFYKQSSGMTINYLVDGGLSTNNPLDYFLLNEEIYDTYNLWLLKFTKEPEYVNINGIVSLLKQILDYLVSGKNDIKMELVQQEYKINCINLHLQNGALDIYPPEKIQEIICRIYDQCCSGQLHFEN